MTDPGHVGSAGVAPPPFTSSLGTSGVRGGLGALRRRLARRRLTSKRFAFGSQAIPAQSSFGGRLQRAGELDDRRQARLAAGPLQQRDLGAVQVAEIAQLFLGDPASVRALLRLRAKRSWGVIAAILLGCGQKLYRQKVHLGLRPLPVSLPSWEGSARRSLELLRRMH